MRSSIRNAVSHKLVLAVAAVVVLEAVSSGAADLGAIHLPGKISPDAEVGLAVFAPDKLYAAYWVEADRDQRWQFMIYEFNISTGRVVAQSEVDKAEPLRSRNGDVIQSSVRLSISPDGSMLLCTTLERGPVRKAWTLSSHDLHILSAGTISSDANLLGFTRNGDVRLLRTQAGGKFGQEIDSATVLDLSAHSLQKSVSEQVVRFREPVWRLIAVSPDNLLWVLDERASPHGEARITAYRLQNGEPIATGEVSRTEAQVGVPATGPRPRGSDLPSPTAIPQPGVPRDAPQLAQMIAIDEAVLGVIHQPAEQWKAWSRVMRIGVPPKQVAWSSILSDCNLMLDMVGRSGRIAAGSCDLVGRVGFDQYAIKKSAAVFVSTETGSIMAVISLVSRRPPLSFAIDDTIGPALAAVYERRATVRLLSIPR